jgi:hypothetical protein
MKAKGAANVGSALMIFFRVLICFINGGSVFRYVEHDLGRQEAEELSAEKADIAVVMDIVSNDACGKPFGIVYLHYAAVEA